MIKTGSKMKKYGKDRITLQIRVPVKMAVSILGRLYGCGIISREQYLEKLENVSKEEMLKEKTKMAKMKKIFSKVS
jgi:tRNA(Phe) wybutosine-synthesizing methylase Tyw3